MTEDRRARVEEAARISVNSEMHGSGPEGSGSPPQSQTHDDDQPGLNLLGDGGVEILWEDRWHEEEIFANRLSFYILTQSFLVFAAVTATLTTDETFRWLPVALTIDLAGLVLTILFWYALTENLRRLDALKDIVAEGSREIGVRGYREIGAVRMAHHEHRAQRSLPPPLSMLPTHSPSWWLAHGIPVLLGTAWLALVAVAVAAAV